jgi:hypothetical protein
LTLAERPQANGIVERSGGKVTPRTFGHCGQSCSLWPSVLSTIPGRLLSGIPLTA